MEVRRARAVDIQKLVRFMVPDRFIGNVVEKDGEYMGMGFIVWSRDDKAFVFFDVADVGRKHKMTIMRWSLKFLDAAKSLHPELYTLQDPNEPTAEKWITWLGFQYTGEVLKGHRVWKWSQLL